MIEAAPFKPDDVKRLINEKGLAHLEPLLESHHIANLEKSIFAYSIFDNDEILACGGVMELWAGRGEAWAFVSKTLGSRAFSVVKLAREILDISSVRRIEATVDCNFIQGHRFLIALGFKIESFVMKGYYADGRNASMYVRTKVN